MTVLEPPALPPLGGPVDLAADAPPVHEVVLDRGSVCALFTDGLVERRGEHLDDGLARVAAVLAGVGSNEGAERIAADLTQACVPADTEDDICLLVVAANG